MLTNNFFAWLSLKGTEHHNSSIEKSFTLTDGSTETFNAIQLVGASNARCYSWIEALTKSESTYGVWFGSGTIIPTREDYTITNKITTLEIQLPAIPNPIISDDGVEYKAAYVVTATEECTITEIGLVCLAFKSNSLKKYLVDHTLLDEPVHLNAGESTVITYTWRFG